jgi:heat shock protein HslJ
MNRFAKLFVPVLLGVTALAVTIILLGACSGFSGAVMNKDWSLIEARTSPADIFFNRSMLKQEGFGEIFTLRFDKDRVNGVAAPNRYFAPYKQEDRQVLSIQQVAGTQMAPLTSPERLKEQDFFIYLQNTYKWGIVGKNLELYSKNAAGTEVVLVFAPGK